MQKLATEIIALRRDLCEAAIARRAVQPVMGDVLAYDSAADIYGAALDRMGVDHKGVTDVRALRALFNFASARSRGSNPKLALDSSLFEKFPNAMREIRVL